MLVHIWCAPTWRFHTELCKLLRNISTNICGLGERTDLKLGEVPSLFIFNRITISWLYPLNGFRFIFLLRDSENDLYVTFSISCVWYSISCVWYTISCTCGFFDQLCLIFDQLCVLFNQLYMWLVWHSIRCVFYAISCTCELGSRETPNCGYLCCLALKLTVCLPGCQETMMHVFRYLKPFIKFIKLIVLAVKFAIHFEIKWIVRWASS